MICKADILIKKLNLQKHPEGGYFKEIYRSVEVIPKTALPDRYSNFRNYSTSIYFLLKENDFSAFHRVKSDEIWHYYKGNSSVNIYIINNQGELEEKILSDSIDKGQFQVIIPAGEWFSAKLSKINSFALMGCTMSPGFEYDDFELADRNILTKEFPQYKDIIRKMTY